MQRLEALGDQSTALFFVSIAGAVVQGEIESRNPVRRGVQLDRGRGQVEREEGDARVVPREAERNGPAGLQARIVCHVYEEAAVVERVRERPPQVYVREEGAGHREGIRRRGDVDLLIVPETRQDERSWVVRASQRRCPRRPCRFRPLPR